MAVDRRPPLLNRGAQLNNAGALNIPRTAVVTTASPSAGAAGALPATPTGYLSVVINGVSRKVAYY